MRARPGQLKEVLGLIKLIANDAHYEEGTLQYQLTVGIDNPDDIRIWEEYVSEDAFEAHKEGQHFQSPSGLFDRHLDHLRQPGCGSHLSTTFEIILSAHIDHLNDSTTELPRSRVIFKAPEKLYRTSGSQYSFAFARKFLESRFGDQEDVEAWVNQVQAQYRELKLHKFDLDALCIMSCSTVCPIAAARFLHSIWTAEKNPSIEDIKNSILWVNAGQLNRSKEKALAAHTASLSLDSTTSLNAFYTGLEKSGKMPSKAHPCARCGSPLTGWLTAPNRPMRTRTRTTTTRRKGKGSKRTRRRHLPKRSRRPTRVRQPPLSPMWSPRPTATRLNTFSSPVTTRTSHLWLARSAGSLTLVRASI
ncbi:hypothetical protein EHS25_001719 [Saitozyma podzolica]|uniref:ABM domain-containing protein n=1 Tax=Saitozyma podzolica TaxID=1890683 RepID=A0A427YFN0_9TREE|nr:hypothetical protein EHS25_001719 [Saitozyma podzolica]